MISKETFVKVMRLNDEQADKDFELDMLVMALVKDVSPSVPNNKAREALILVLAEIFDDKEDLIRYNQFAESDPDDCDFDNYEDLYDYLVNKSVGGNKDAN